MAWFFVRAKKIFKKVNLTFYVATKSRGVAVFSAHLDFYELVSVN